ncbi:MAG: hypothetical protein IPP51_16685 [Bacteroidetes bacterium]|nr:hypothetical protein [Bacteroidota bacterium]
MYTNVYIDVVKSIRYFFKIWYVSIILIPGFLGVVYAFFTYQDDLLQYVGYYVTFGMLAGFIIDAMVKSYKRRKAE